MPDNRYDIPRRELALKLTQLEIQLRCAELTSGSKSFDERAIDVYNRHLKESVV